MLLASLSGQDEQFEDTEVFELEGVTVGITASMLKAQQIKKESGQVMDSIVADDINKLPDLSVTEALQRISGIQVSRDLGEGANVSLRGLTDVTSTVNGQEVFSPQIVTGESRVMNLQTIPSDMIREINVLKSPTADMIEGGIAGTIDIRLRRPLDFDGDTHGSFQLRNGYSELAGESKIQYSGMLTDTWDIGEEGRFGALFSYSLQDRISRQDMNQTSAPKGYNVGTADEVVASGGSYEPLFIIDRSREGILTNFEYAPNDRLSFFLEYNESSQTSKQETHGVQFETPAATATDIVTSGNMITYTRNGETVTVPHADALTVTDGDVISFAAYRYWLEDTSQLSAGGTWSGDNLTIEAEIAKTDTYSDFFYNGIHPKTDAAHEFRFDSRTKVPQTYPIESDLLSTRSNFTQYLYSWTAWREHHGDALTASLDFTQSLGHEFFDSLKYGARFNDRKSGQDEYGGLYNFGWPSADEIVPPGENPNMLVENDFSDFFDGAVGKTNNYLYPNLAILRAPDVDTSWYQLATELGSSSPDTTETPQDRVWEIEEESTAGYFMANFSGGDSGPFRFDGNAGVRIVETKVTSNGYKRSSGGDWQTFTETGSYTDVLPSLNGRFHLPGRDFYLRVSLSKQLSRHSLSSLNSRMTLTPVEGQDGYDWTGSAGNPNLEPLRTEAIDISLEKYFNESTNVYVSFYDKSIDGYKQNSSTIEVIDGENVLVTRPYNVDDAKVSGFEIGYQQFFTFLPEPFRGFGINANGTYVDATDPSGEPLQNLSETSYNVILMYEKNKFSTRIAYNWRDSFTRSTTNGGALGSSVPLVDDAFGWMDATVGYDLTDSVRVQLDVANVLQAHREDFYDGNPLFDHEDVLEDRMWYLSLNYKL
ncbi:TonB-dependent receptor [Pelagicoccus albus]|uniref:TonB-dependent receptor n=1 Tax=Pelagicoccus albus TaxID=415222 RepID=A0A7X1B9E8_9BACT|nr:TonB-dependent receptor [Pelagicoccus albus]MBC2608093.1 TonB-dependent receptor [Pelagicoccus albus]